MGNTLPICRSRSICRQNAWPRRAQRPEHHARTYGHHFNEAQARTIAQQRFAALGFGGW